MFLQNGGLGSRDLLENAAVKMIKFNNKNYMTIVYNFQLTMQHAFRMK